MTQTVIPVFYEAKRGGIRCESEIKEMFNESLFNIQQTINWQNIFYRRQNMAQNKLPEIAPEILEKIKTANALDLELYKQGKKILEKYLSTYNIYQKQQLKFFNLTNNLINKIFPNG